MNELDPIEEMPFELPDAPADSGERTTAQWIEQALHATAPLFTRSGNTWYAMPAGMECRHAPIVVVHDGHMVRVSIATGQVIPPGRRDDVTRLMMAANPQFKVARFDPSLKDGCPTFTFCVDEQLLSRSLDEYGTLLPPGQTVPDGDLAGCCPETFLQYCLLMALQSIFLFTPRFSAIAYGGKSAFDVASL